VRSRLTILSIFLAVLPGCFGGGASIPPHPILKERVLGVDGVETSLVARQAEITLVHFWASWCTSCVFEMQSLAKLPGLVADSRFAVIALAVDDTLPAVRALGFRNDTRFWVALDHLGTVKSWAKVNSLPTTIVIDRTGRVLPIDDPESGGETTKIEGMRNWANPTFARSLSALVDQAS
jgi:thiol-disulfide isomerase/thioredoxin